MSIARRIKLDNGDVFPYGAYLVSEVTPVVDWEQSTKDSRVQKHDSETGLPLWQVEVLDADPEAQKRSRTVTVKIAAKVQPVSPAASGTPFTAVEFDRLTALPYVDDSGQGRPRIAWSFLASDMRAPQARNSASKNVA